MPGSGSSPKNSSAGTSARWVRRDPTTPAAHTGERIFWTSGADGKLRFRRCAKCGSFQHPPGPICRTCGSDDLAPEPGGRDGRVGRLHRERAHLDARPPAAVHRRHRGHRRGSPGQADHQPGGRASVRARRGATGRGAFRAHRGRMAPGLHPGLGRSGRGYPSGRGAHRTLRAAHGAGRQVRGQGGADRYRHVQDRTAPRCGPAGPDRRGLTQSRRRRRADHGRHRRALHLSRQPTDGRPLRGRGHGTGGVPPDPTDLDQRGGWRRRARAGR